MISNISVDLITLVATLTINRNTILTTLINYGIEKMWYNWL